MESFHLVMVRGWSEKLLLASERQSWGKLNGRKGTKLNSVQDFIVTGPSSRRQFQFRFDKMNMDSYPRGTAPIKTEFLIRHIEQSSVYDDDAAEGSKRPPHRLAEGDLAETKQQKKAQRGQNKGRKFGKVRDGLELCWKVGNGILCESGETYRVLIFVLRFLSNSC